MKFSYNWLQSFFEKELPDAKKLADILTMKSFEVEGVEKEGDDWMLDIDILPNRAHDCLSHYGLARECAALLQFEIHPVIRQGALSDDRVNQKNDDILQVSIESKELVPRYSAFVIDGVEVTDSPQWMQERLAAMEQKPISNIVDITNYIMWELGQPLHAFDFDKIRGGKMTIRTSKAGEKLETLDGVSRILDDATIIIEDARRLIDLAGIKGGSNTQVEKGTRRVVLQAAIFDPIRIRRSMQALGARTDASVRYMHGFDPNATVSSLNRAVAILLETSKSATVVQKVDIYPTPVAPKKIALDVERANRLLGSDISKKEALEIVTRLGFSHKSSGKKDEAVITVPTYRRDIEIEEDIIEELGRIHGYEKIAARMPSGVLRVPKRNKEVFWRNRARSVLTGMGFNEMYNYSLISERAASAMRDAPAEIANPISDEFKYLRPFLLSGILKNIALNSKYEEVIKIFEIGKVFQKIDAGIGEREHLAMALVRPDDKTGAPAFYEIKGFLDEFFKKLGIANTYYDPAFSASDTAHAPLLHNGRRANIRIESGEDTFLGFFGEVLPKLRESAGVKSRVFYAELRFGKIAKEAISEHNYEPISKYPEVVRDVAVLAPREVTVAQALNVINAVSGSLLRDVDLFDMYEGEGIPNGMKNLAFHLIFQSREKTLTAKEVDEIMKKIIKTIEDEGWEVR